MGDEFVAAGGFDRLWGNNKAILACQKSRRKEKEKLTRGRYKSLVWWLKLFVGEMRQLNCTVRWVAWPDHSNGVGITQWPNKDESKRTRPEILRFSERSWLRYVFNNLYWYYFYVYLLIHQMEYKYDYANIIDLVISLMHKTFIFFSMIFIILILVVCVCYKGYCIYKNNFTKMWRFDCDWISQLVNCTRDSIIYRYFLLPISS